MTEQVKQFFEVLEEFEKTGWPLNLIIAVKFKKPKEVIKQQPSE